MLIINVFFIICSIHFSAACNGYTIKLLSYKTCVEDSILKLPEKDFGIVLDSDCNIYGTGCVEVTKDFTTAKAKYQVKKAPLPVIEGEVDLCQLSDILKKSPELIEGLSVMGVPTKCPVAAAKICGGPDRKFSIAKFKNQIGMGAGTASVKIEIEHDSGKSCVEMQTSVSKPRKG